MNSRMRLVVNVTRDKRVHKILEETITSDKTVGKMFSRVYVRSRDELVREMEKAQVLFSFAVPEDGVKRAEKLQWIHLASAGVEKSLTPALVKSDIKVTCSRGIHAATIAEYVIMQMLNFSKKTRQAYKYQDKCQWRFEELVTGKFDLEGKTVCIIGLGSIGRQVAKLAKAFGMKVIGTVNHQRPIRNVDKVYLPTKLAECLPLADFVVLATPLTAKTRHLIGRWEFSAMKKNAFFINIGRGRLLNELALIDALRKKKIAGAALDVFEAEPLPPNSPLWGMENVAVTPHYSGMAENLWKQVAGLFCENAVRFKNGKRLLGIVNKKEGY